MFVVLYLKGTTVQPNLIKDSQYFTDHKAELCKKHEGKHIVIHDANVVGIYNTENEAYVESVKKYGLGNFLIQYCDKKGESSTQTFHSRVSFV
jgi:Family of unknown function (DUF5678)